jgi:hypothetical protein
MYNFGFNSKELDHEGIGVEVLPMIMDLEFIIRKLQDF